MQGKIMLHDLRRGIAANGWRYALAAFFFSAVNIRFFTAVRDAPPQLLYPPASALDGWIHHMAGIGIHMPETKAPFPIPISWLILQALMALLILSYPTRDLYGYGAQILLRTKSRSGWWLSKCLWNSLTVLLFYGIGFLTTCFFSGVLGRFSLASNHAVNLRFSGIDLKGFSTGEILLLTLLLPVLTSLALSLLQMALSFILSPLYGYFMVICYGLAAACYCSPLLTPNFSMALRHERITPEGVGTAEALVINGLLIVVSVGAGLLYFNRQDIMKRPGRK